MYDITSVGEELQAVRQELSLVVIRLTELDLHMQMIDRNLERLLQLVITRVDNMTEQVAAVARLIPRK